MSEYTPTTEQVRNAVRPYRIHPDEFDRWLAEHDREVRTAAFEEAAGYFGENQMTREGDVKEWLRNKAAAIREGRA